MRQNKFKRNRGVYKCLTFGTLHKEAQRLHRIGGYAILAEAEALKLQARLEDLTVWEMEKVKQSRKGSKT